MAMKVEVWWVIVQGSLSCFAMLVLMGLQGSLHVWGAFFKKSEFFVPMHYKKGCLALLGSLIPPSSSSLPCVVGTALIFLGATSSLTASWLGVLALWFLWAWYCWPFSWVLFFFCLLLHMPCVFDPLPEAIFDCYFNFCFWCCLLCPPVSIVGLGVSWPFLGLDVWVLALAKEFFGLASVGLFHIVEFLYG